MLRNCVFLLHKRGGFAGGFVASIFLRWCIVGGFHAAQGVVRAGSHAVFGVCVCVSVLPLVRVVGLPVCLVAFVSCVVLLVLVLSAFVVTSRMLLCLVLRTLCRIIA